MSSKRLIVVCACVLVALGWAGQAGAAIHWVNDDGTPSPPGASCARPGYSTVQSAVTAAAPGDRIIVCEGTYVEQVTVSTSLQIEGKGDAVIKAPDVMTDPKAIVLISGATTDTSLEKLTITGPGGSGCDSIRYGVRVDGGAHADIRKDHITQIHDTPFGGCQNGVAILVGRNAEATTGTAVIENNRIDNYQKNGPTVDNAGSSAIIRHNKIDGIGPTPITAQNGIQVSRGATGEVSDNEVTDNTYSLANLGVFSATGILLYNPGAGVVIDQNKGSRSDDNLGLYGTADATVSHNHFDDSTFYDGIFVNDDSTNNQITDNKMNNNYEYDCNDFSTGPGTSGTGNWWIHDHGQTEYPPGICTRDN